MVLTALSAEHRLNQSQNLGDRRVANITASSLLDSVFQKGVRITRLFDILALSYRLFENSFVPLAVWN